MKVFLLINVFEFFLTSFMLEFKIFFFAHMASFNIMFFLDFILEFLFIINLFRDINNFLGFPLEKFLLFLLMILSNIN